MNNPLAALILLLLPLTWNAGNCAPHWIERASRPGPDLPQYGQSRFDQIFGEATAGHRIPYPFDKLVESLETRFDNDGNPAVRQVFVPIGRSLQRDAPAPDYFRFPRRVIAVDGETVSSGNEAGLVMAYRMFIAHQPGSETLEVISYNDAAGRFEFQVVENYTAGATPKVSMAARVMCLSCHQNAAPIFARMPWSETSFNVAVASRLVDALPDQFGSLIGTVTADAGLIDVLVERANYLSAAQLIWRQGCGRPECRAAMLRAMLQYRLSGESNFTEDGPSYRRDYLDELTRNWNRLWPEGLALPGSRIDDRDPLATQPPGIELDPLFARPPHATWRRADSALARGIIYRLAGFMTQADIRRIDRQLIQLGNAAPTRDYEYRASCKVIEHSRDSAVLACGDSTRVDSLQATIELEYLRQQIDSLRIRSLRVPQDANLMQPDVSGFTLLPGRLEIITADRNTGLSQRLATGDRIRSMVLSWRDSPRLETTSLAIQVSAEFRFIETALQELLDETGPTGAASLASPVFNRRQVLQELTPILGMEPLDWEQMAARGTVAPRRVANRLVGQLALLEPYCGHCHGENRINPPGFLAGADPEAKILQCAPRMLRRLRAWHSDHTIARSPMPPLASLEFSGISASDWPSSDHYRSIVESLENLALERHDQQTVFGWREADYLSLPACLARVSE